MTRFIAKTARTLALSAVAVAGLTGAGLAGGKYDGYIQTIDVSSTKGKTEMHQIFQPGTRNEATTRVCLINLGNRTKTFTHAVRGVNALQAGPFSRSCANFDSSLRLGLGMLDGGEPAQPSKTMVMTLAAFKGGTVSFMWE